MQWSRRVPLLGDLEAAPCPLGCQPWLGYGGKELSARAGLRSRALGWYWGGVKQLERAGEGRWQEL